MRITTFLCPNTGVWLQTWCANNGSEDNNETYERVTWSIRGPAMCWAFHMPTRQNNRQWTPLSHTRRPRDRFGHDAPRARSALWLVPAHRWRETGGSRRSERPTRLSQRAWRAAYGPFKAVLEAWEEK